MSEIVKIIDLHLFLGVDLCHDARLIILKCELHLHACARVRRVIDEASLAHGTRVSLSVLEIVSNVAWDITELLSQLIETLLSSSSADQYNFSTVDLADCES